MSGCDKPGHEKVVAFAFTTAYFPPARGQSVELQFRDDGCLTWKKTRTVETRPEP